MTKVLRVFLVVTISLFFMAACQPLPKTENHAQFFNRKWMMIGFQDYSKNELIEQQAYLDLTNQNSNNQFSAKMGCNTILFNFKLKNSSDVKFSNISRTRMFCKDAMSLEDAFMKRLETMTQLQIEGHFLTLKNDKGETMKFVAADWD